MADFDNLTPDQQKQMLALDPRQAKIMTVEIDHLDDVYMLLKWDSSYIDIIGIETTPIRKRFNL